MTNAEYRHHLRQLKLNPSGLRRWGMVYQPLLMAYPWLTYAEAALTAKLAEHGISEEHQGDVPDRVWHEAKIAFGVAATEWVRERKAVGR